MNATAPHDGCPLCDKPVMGRTALLGHLEFGHDIADPEAYLARLEQPERSRRSRSGAGGRLAKIVAGIVVVAALGVGALLAFQAASGDADVASGPGGSTTTVAPTTTAAPSTTAPAEAPTSAPATTEAPAPTTTATTASTTTTAAPAVREDAPFRAPFLLNAETIGCTTKGGVDVHEFRFEFSGALNITFDGVFYPDDSGDGVRTSTHEIPAGSSTYLDEVVVLDPAGGEHPVKISPPLYLGSC